MESLFNPNRRSASVSTSSSMLPKHPKQQRRGMEAKPILSTLGNIAVPKKRLNVPRKNAHAVQHDVRSGLPIDSLSSALFFSESDDEDEENCAHRPKSQCSSQLQHVKHKKHSAGQSSNAQQTVVGANLGVWACSSLLTGLSLRDTGSNKPATLKSQSIDGEKAKKNALNQNDTRGMKKSTLLPLREGLSSFLTKNSESDDDDNSSFYRTLKHRMTTTIPEKRNRIVGRMSSKLVQKQLETKDCRKLGKGEALKKAYAVAGRPYRANSLKCIQNPSKRYEHSESALCIAATHHYEADSDSSSHQQGNLLSLFQSQLTFTKHSNVRASEFTGVCHPNLESDQATKLKTEIETNISSKRLMFTSPVPKVDRHRKRRDRKKTPKIKPSCHSAKRKQVNQIVHEPMVDVIVENINVKDGEYINDNDTASSLSDDSILEYWNHSSAMTGFVPPTKYMSPIPQSTKKATVDDFNTHDVPLIDEIEDDTPQNSPIVIDGSGKNGRESLPPEIPMIDETMDDALSKCPVVIDTMEKPCHVIISNETPFIDETTNDAPSNCQDEIDTLEKPCHEIMSTKKPCIDETINDTPSSSCQVNIDTLEKPCHEIMSTEKPFIDETINDTPSTYQDEIDIAEHIKHTTTSVRKMNIVDDTKETSSHHSEDQKDTSMKDIEKIRRSHRVRTVTNRFTIDDSECQPSKSKSRRNRQRDRSETISKSNDNEVPDRDFVDSISKCTSTNIKCSMTTGRKDHTIGNLQTNAMNVERPRRNRTKTDFYHDKISVEETCKSRTVVATLNETMPTVRQSSILNPHVMESNLSDPAADDKADKKQEAVVRNRPSVFPKVENSEGIDAIWSTDQLEQLRDAQLNVDPTSVSYWTDAASHVHGKSASECQAKWFSMTKTPAPKTKSRRVAVLPSDVNESNHDEDDIFQSTPMRGNTFLNSNFLQTFTSVKMPQLPTPLQPSSVVDHDTLDQPVDAFAPIMKPVSKAFLQRMKRNFTKAEATMATKSKSLQKNHSSKNGKGLTEVLRDHDIDINIRLTPGGTLQVKSHVDHDEDDFWDDEYDADEENDDAANYCYK